eukprot:scaffold808_cov370-Prasinococcus_capsulatus_cf.AAC.24
MMLCRTARLRRCRRNPRWAKGFWHKGRALESLGWCGEALECYEELLTTSPDTTPEQPPTPPSSGRGRHERTSSFGKLFGGAGTGRQKRSLVQRRSACAWLLMKCHLPCGAYARLMLRGPVCGGEIREAAKKEVGELYSRVLASDPTNNFWRYARAQGYVLVGEYLRGLHEICAYKDAEYVQPRAAASAEERPWPAAGFVAA